jgi:hypothetical protein
MKNPKLLLPLLALLLFARCEDDDETVLLPASIQSYLDTHYSGYEVDESSQETLCTGTTVYEVDLEKSENDEVSLTFDTEGNLLFTETEIPVADLPAAVTAGISTHYGAYTIDEAERQDLAAGGQQYKIELTQGSTRLDVLFNADGTVVCEEPGDEDDDE